MVVGGRGVQLGGDISGGPHRLRICHLISPLPHQSMRVLSEIASSSLAAARTNEARDNQPEPAPVRGQVLLTPRDAGKECLLVEDK